jgi:hypothetical protein
VSVVSGPRRSAPAAGLVTPERLPGLGGARRARRAERARRAGRSERWVPAFELPTVPRPPGDRVTDPVLVEIVIDESPSEVDADPRGHRHVAARRIVELLRIDLTDPGDRVAVIHFAERPRPRLRPQNPHAGRGRRRLQRMLQPRGGGPTTDIRAALETAARLVPRRWPGLVVVMLLTDGYDQSTADELEAAVRRFPPGSVHVLSIEAPLPEVWDDVPLGSTSVVPSVSRPDAVEWAAARLLYRALRLGAGPSARD